MTYYIRHITSRWKKENPSPFRYFWGDFFGTIKQIARRLAISLLHQEIASADEVSLAMTEGDVIAST